MTDRLKIPWAAGAPLTSPSRRLFLSPVGLALLGGTLLAVSLSCVLTKRPFRACSDRSTKCHLACLNICAITPSPRRTAHHYGTNFISVPMAPVPIAVAPAPVISASTAAPAATAAAPPPASATYPNADATAASASVVATPATVTSAAVMAPSTAVAAVPSTAVAAVTTMADKLYE